MMFKDACDGAAVTVTAASLLGWFPAISSVLTIAWMLIRIYESKTVQDWLNKKGDAHEY